MLEKRRSGCSTTEGCHDVNPIALARSSYCAHFAIHRVGTDERQAPEISRSAHVDMFQEPHIEGREAMNELPVAR